MKTYMLAAALLAALGVQADTLVNWGAADTGADMFAASANHNPKPGTVYAAGNVYGDETVHSVSSVAPVESQTYNAAAYATVAITISKDIHDDVGSGAADGGDSVFIQAPSSTFLQAMVVWENFVSTNTTLTSIAMGGRYVGSSGAFRYLIEKDNGGSTSWYVSDPALTLALSYASASSTDPASLTWYAFTPVNNDGGVIGSVATPGMNDITSVGVYADIAKTTAGNTGFKLNYFNATSGTSGPPVNQPPSFANDPFNKPNADIDVGYTNSIAGDASDPESDPMEFLKTDGPDWLTVDVDGTIIGTPASNNVGVNAFTVQVSATGGVDTAVMNVTVNAPPAPPTGWEEFVSDYDLSGDKFDDADSDGVFDIYEYAHGGNPTNPADKGVAPVVEYGTDDVASFICVETANTNSGITYTAEWIDNLTTNNWSQIWDATNVTAATLPGYNEVERQLNGTGQSKLFFRNRLFPAAPTPSGERPNILIIMCDDLGYSDVGYNRDYSIARWGQITPAPAHAINTPEIDSLAANGMIFAQAYVPHPFCGPSRVGIMSGRYPHHIGALENLPYETANRPSLVTQTTWGYEPANEIGGILTNETTMATVLQDAGYHTGMIGKWHMGVADFAHPNNRGFDYWFGMLGGGHNYYAPWLSKYDPSVVNDYQFWLTRQAAETNILSGYLTDILSVDAVDFIEQAPSDEPFFLFLSYTAPHSPMQGKSEDLIARFGGSGAYGAYSDRQNLVAMMDAVDRGVGDVVAALTAKGVMDDTLIVFLSDNGGREVEDDADNNPLKGGKGDTYDGGVRVPMFMHYPNAIPAGEVYDYPMSAYDFFPTFARLAETTIPEGKTLAGKDIWDGIVTNGNAHVDDTIIWARYLSNGYSLGLRKNDIKATRKNFGVWSVYDLSTDVGEASNIITDPAASAELDAMLLVAQEWGTHGLDPLWFNSEISYTNWNVNGMPKYDQSFSR
ncbi:sulfatase-like hydrolase/transferase [Pontiella sulfatireligans]|uniref:Arylsulfatase n=1 Tax=Pontiella sulfatireligans TaxID=2750658 RepID=A0A6C2UGS4_9BACT|nr:sulfatase-like hydrolase/transferase [Pontiella sulfatireligans]SPS74230.1 sulfatase S1_19 [Kiritimatiellales bacterium]VGO18717.1 Arylsulfatase [Pontiella sulfatireligans]